MDKKESYKQIVKTTSLFGGVEIFRILVNVLQTKVVAILLGPAGVGLINMFTTVVNMFVSGFGFGLNTSAVKEVAQAKASSDNEKISKTILSLRRIVRITALFGAVAMICFSKPISIATFGHSGYTFAFVVLSLSLILNIISNGQIALIKGMRYLGYLAKCSLIGAVASLVFSIPFYYWWGQKGIVYVIVLTSLSYLLCTWFYARKIKILEIKLSWKESFFIGKDMLKMGFFLMLSTFLGQLTSFMVNAYISNTGSVDDVGFYRAGFLITSHYVGLIFAAMSADFLPRLTSVNKDSQLLSTVVHQQTELAILIIAPLVAYLFPLTHLFINILYSSEFYSIDGYINWASLGLVPRACVWVLSYILLAKGESKKFFITELFYNTTYVGLCIWGYRVDTLTGLGIAFFVHNVVCLFFNYYMVKYFCAFSYTKKMILGIILTTVISVLLFFINYAVVGLYGKVIIVIIAILMSAYSLVTIINKTGLKLIRKK